jgi:hypothetical protein
MVATVAGQAVQVGDQLTAIDGGSAIFKTVPQVCSLMSTCANPQQIELTFCRYVGLLYPLSQEDVLARERAHAIAEQSDAEESDGEHFWTKSRSDGKAIDLLKLSESRSKEWLALQEERAVLTKKKEPQSTRDASPKPAYLAKTKPRYGGSAASTAPSLGTSSTTGVKSILKKKNPLKKLFGKKK